MLLQKQCTWEIHRFLILLFFKRVGNGEKSTPSIAGYFSRFRILRPSAVQPGTTHQYLEIFYLAIKQVVHNIMTICLTNQHRHVTAVRKIKSNTVKQSIPEIGYWIVLGVLELSLTCHWYPHQESLPLARTCPGPNYLVLLLVQNDFLKRNK